MLVTCNFSFEAMKQILKWRKADLNTWSTPGIPPDWRKCIWLALTDPNCTGYTIQCHLSAAEVEASIVREVLHACKY